MRSGAHGYKRPVVRFLLATRHAKVVWSGSPIETLPGNFQLRGMAHVPLRFPMAAVRRAILPNISWKKQTNGCWPSLLPITATCPGLMARTVTFS
jgi:hypothetical protein